MLKNLAARRCVADRVTGGRCWAWAVRGATVCVRHRPAEPATQPGRRPPPPRPAKPPAQSVSAEISSQSAPTADATDPPPFWRELL